MIDSLSIYGNGIYIRANSFNKKNNPELLITAKKKAEEAQSKKIKNSGKNNISEKSLSGIKNSVKSNQTEKLNDEEKKIVDNLKKAETEVITHEQAHIAGGGGLVKGGASYTYQSGPDGKQYITGGEVQIDASAVSDDPEATISKMQQVKKAALAPAEPSSQDKKVASEAAQKEISARAELSQKQIENFKKVPDYSSILINTYA